MIGTCPSRLIYMASKVLASKVIVNPLVGKGHEKARIEVTETNIKAWEVFTQDTGSGMLLVYPLEVYPLTVLQHIFYPHKHSL